jgi:hypothetical protein
MVWVYFYCGGGYEQIWGIINLDSKTKSALVPHEAPLCSVES